jgi:hypothetical protein
VAQKVQVLLIDDIAGGEADGTVRFGLDGACLRASFARAGTPAAGLPVRRTGLLVATVLAASVLAACSGGSSPQATQAASTASGAASFWCGSPGGDGHQQPAVAVILLDGVGSQEDGGIYYPFPVAKPRPGVPVVQNFCPLNKSYQERTFPDLPSGLDSSLRRWSEFSVAGGSSGGSSAPMASQACDRTVIRSVPGPSAPGPAPAPSPGAGTQVSPLPSVTETVPGGFGRGTCLTEALADAGAVLLPYSYTGASLSPDGTFVQNSYTSGDSKQLLCISVISLAREISSVHSAWPYTAIFLIGHSYGGLVAETWWYDQQQSGGGQCSIRGGMAGVDHVFSLDSPINGVQKCALAFNVIAGQAASTWCDLWGGDLDHGVLNGLKIAAIDNHELSFTAVGTPNDPTYGSGLSGGGGGLEAQLVYDCPGSYDQNDPAASCIDTTGGSLPVSYPSASPQCDGTSGNIYGTTGHDTVKTCPAVIQMIIGSLRLATATSPPPVPSHPVSPSQSPPSQATPGYGSPQDAVDGFYQSELAGDWAAVCSYVTPSAQALCLAGTSGQGAATGHVTVGNAVISGNEALVAVTGSICAPSTPCVANSDPSLGMPPSPSQFAVYYQRAVANSTTSTTVISPIPCSDIGGKWYVEFG